MKDVLKQWWVILLCSISVSLLTYVGVSYTHQPLYSSSATLVVTSKTESTYSYKNLKAAEDTAAIFSQVLSSNLLQKTVQEDTKIKNYNAITQVKQIEETNMLELTVSASNARDAFRIITSILRNYDKVSDYAVGKVNVMVLQQPKVAAASSNPVNVRYIMMRSFIAGFVLLTVILLILSFLRNTVKNVQQFNQKIDAKSLGVIYHEQKNDKQNVSRLGNVLTHIRDLLPIKEKNDKEVDMLIQNPRRSFFYVEANKMASNRVRNKMDRADAQVAIITSVTENEGKSTVSANIALGIAKDGKKVLFIDADFRKPSQYKIFQLEEGEQVNLLEYLTNPDIEEEPAKQYKDTSLYLIANNATTRDGNQNVPMDGLKHIIEYYRQKMDYIFIDSAPMAYVSDTEAIASLVDRTILVVKEDCVLTPHINDAIDTMNTRGAKVLGCILNDAHKGFTRIHHGDYYGRYGGYYGRRT